MSDIDSLRMQVQRTLFEKGSPQQGALLKNWVAFRQALQNRIERDTGFVAPTVLLPFSLLFYS
jgi:hypothetical protein